MKILWLCNIMLPRIAVSISKPVSFGGGWLVGLSDDLLKNDDIELVVCFPALEQSNNIEGSIGNLNYYGFTQEKKNPTKYNKKVEKSFEYIINKTNPDIIHIFGTEYPHTLAMVNACKKLGLINKVIINIQGLVSVYARHYNDGLPNKVIHSFTFRDFIKQDNIRQQRNNFIKRGQTEIKALQKAKHVIGRTDWDKACTSQINSYASYYFCNETLRNEFYKHSWDINECEKNSIFISQASYPIKGLHFMLEAMPIILKKFPNTKLYVSGENIIKSDTLKDKLRKASYSRYISKLVNRYNLSDCIIFTGALDEKQMCERFLKSHVFVSPSSIENSPNSVGEAMILGVPTVTSDVGGVKNMLTHNADGFVNQHNAPYMLAYYVCEIFASDELALNLSKKAIAHALKTHDREKNLETLLNIYDQILRG